MLGAMRHGSLFAALRGTDGRSLARALIVLVLVNLFAGGLSAGAFAAGGDAAFCSVDASSDASGAPHRHEPDCCLPGSMPFSLALAASAPTPAPPTEIRRAEILSTAHGGPAGGEKIPATARGPPLDV